MTIRRILFFLLGLLILSLLLQPKVVWAEMKRIKEQWNTILRLMVLVVGLYLLYGVYRIWQTGVLWRL